MELKTDQQTLVKKLQILEEAKKQLKKEFVGIDPIIDQVITSCNSWYLLPHLQERPVVVNLWGLTGVGKSSLLKRLSELIGMDKKYYRFDLGDKKNSDWSISSKMKDINEGENGYPMMLCFDEFQHVKTLEESGREIANQYHRIIWDILDSGRFMNSRDSFDAKNLYQLIKNLEYALERDVEVENGIVIFGNKFFKKKIQKRKTHWGKDVKEKNKTLYFISNSQIDDIYDLAEDEYKSSFEISMILRTMDGKETISFLYNMLNIALSPKEVDCSKAIVFVVGNLDKAFKMSCDYNPDMDADEFYKQSLKINVGHIKQALRSRFRNEQIARLGNNHIIYPAFSSSTYRKLIELELEKIAKRIKKELEVDLVFKESINDLIYSEGVYPTQGTRPVFTTINQIINSKLGNIFVKFFIKNIKVDTIVLRREKDEMVIAYINNGNEVYSYSEGLNLTLQKLREPKKDDYQALVAVHECGHAVLNIILLNVIPDLIFSNSVDVNSGGFVYASYPWKYVSKKEILPRIAVYLGGIAAEKLIFGDDFMTTGAENDIEQATEFAAKMLKNSGMGRLFANYQSVDFRTSGSLHDDKNEINNAVRVLIEQAQELAFETLKSEKKLLIQMANYLSDHRTISKSDISRFISLYANTYNINDLITNGDNLYYRNKLKSQLNNVAEIASHSVISLNKEVG